MATSVGVPDRLEAKAREAVSCAGVSANPTGPGVRTSGHSRASCAKRTRTTFRPRQCVADPALGDREGAGLGEVVGDVPSAQGASPRAARRMYKVVARASQD